MVILNPVQDCDNFRSSAAAAARIRSTDYASETWLTRQLQSPNDDDDAPDTASAARESRHGRCC